MALSCQAGQIFKLNIPSTFLDFKFTFILYTNHKKVERVSFKYFNSASKNISTFFGLFPTVSLEMVLKFLNGVRKSK
jgi:hypothetical protein